MILEARNVVLSAAVKPRVLIGGVGVVTTIARQEVATERKVELTPGAAPCVVIGGAEVVPSVARHQVAATAPVTARRAR